MDLAGSSSLKDIPDLSMATNLERLRLGNCESLVELPSSIQNLNKLLKLDMESCKSLEILPTGFNLKSLEQVNLENCSELRTFPEFSTNISLLHLLSTNIEEFPSNLHLENIDALQISNGKSDWKRWEGVKPFTPFLAMLSPTLTYLWLENIPSLVELPSSFQNLNQLKALTIAKCRNLETLPSGINLQSLDRLNFSGCSRLRSFPEISTNISRLFLDETGIEEVPWRIEKFANLIGLTMNGCNKLKCVSLNISKLKHLWEVDFSDCGALTRVDLSGNRSGVEMEAENIVTVSEEASSSIPKVKLCFKDCFNLDPETFLNQQSIIFKSIIMQGEELPPYFTHRTTGMSSLTIRLLHFPLSQPFFRFRVGVVGTGITFGADTKLNCEFKCRFGNSFDIGFHHCNVSTYYAIIRSIPSIHSRPTMLTILDCRIPLNEDNPPLAQRNYDHVDMHIHITSIHDSMLKLKGWGIRVLDECSLPENRLPHVCESDEDNLVNKTKHSEECVETVVKRQRKAEEGNMGYTPLQGLVNANEHSEEFGENNEETERSRKRMRLYQFI